MSEKTQPPNDYVVPNSQMAQSQLAPPPYSSSTSPYYTSTPPAGMPPPPPSQPTVDAPTQQTTIVMQTTALRDYPVTMTCPHCQSQITTSVSYEPGTMTWVAAGIICLLGGWLGCCLIPFCIDGLQDATHSCPACHKTIGHFKRM